MTTSPTTTVRPETRPGLSAAQAAVRTVDVVKTYGAGDSAGHALRSASVDSFAVVGEKAGEVIGTVEAGRTVASSSSCLSPSRSA